MEKRWWCVSCLAQISLDKHGRCDTCGSDAVAMIGPGLSFLTTGEAARTVPSALATRPVKANK